MASPQRDRILNQALGMFKYGQFVDAQRLCQRLLRKDRNDVDALHLLGMVTHRLGDHNEAAAIYERCHQRRPRDATILVKLANMNVLQGRFERAEARYDEALKHHPEYAAALWGKAELLERQGQLDEARDLLLPFVESGQEDAQAAAVLARIDVRTGNTDRAIELVNRHLSKGDLKPETKRHLLRILGKAHEKDTRYDEAFAAFKAANEASPGVFDPQFHIRLVDSLIQTFSKSNWARLPRSSNNSERPIFIIGFYRSGSTLLEQILGSHPEVACGSELPAFPNLLNLLAPPGQSNITYPECLFNVKRDAMDRLARKYLADLAAIEPNAPRFTDKMLDNYFNVGLINLMFTKARVIHTQRHPLDVCLSCFTNLTSHSHAYGSKLDHLAIKYIQYQRLMQHWRDVADVQMYEVRYEELTRDQERLSRELIDFCGLEWDDRCLDFHKAEQSVITASYAQVRKPMYQSSVHRYKPYEKHLEPFRAALAEAGVEIA